LSKVLEKKFPVQVSTISDPNLFSGKEPQRALEAVVLEHLVRDNKWETASQFAKVSRRRRGRDKGRDIEEVIGKD